MACEKVGESLKDGNNRLVILNFFRPDQGELELCQKQFSAMRNYFTVDNHKPCPSAAVYALASIISYNQNSTLITKACATILGLNTTRYPNLYPVVNSLKGATYTIYGLWTDLIRNTNSSIRILQQSQLDLNFAYCDVPKVKLERPWNFSTFTSPFDSILWTLLFISIILVTMILKFSDSSNEQALSESCMTTFSTLVAVTPSLKKGKSFLILVLWMYTCQLLAIFYTGSITSSVIAPAEEETLASITDLARDDDDYDLIFDFVDTKNFVESVAMGYHGEEDIDEDNRWTLEDIASLKKLFRRQVYLAGNENNLISELISGKKVATIQSWPFLMSKVTSANDRLLDEGKLDNYHCYTGKRLVPSGGIYYGIYSPFKENIDSGITFQRIFESGIYHYWTREHVRMQYSKRVQDRVKFVSPTKMRYNFETDVVAPIDLQGRISTVFFTWTLGIFIGGVILVLELAFYRKRMEVKKFA